MMRCEFRLWCFRLWCWAVALFRRVRTTCLIFGLGVPGFRGLVSYGPSEVVYRGTAFGPTTLRYVSGDVDGYKPATISADTYSYEGKPFLPAWDYSSSAGPLDGPAFAVGGFDLATFNLVDGVGAQPVVFATLWLELPNSYLGGGPGYTLEEAFPDSAGLTVTEVASTPEPSSLWLLGTGVMGFGGWFGGGWGFDWLGLG